jgi:hypothetical protein
MRQRIIGAIGLSLLTLILGCSHDEHVVRKERQTISTDSRDDSIPGEERTVIKHNESSTHVETDR